MKSSISKTNKGRLDMAPRPEVEKLPPDTRQWLNSEIIARHFSDYEGLSAELAERGFHIGKSTIHRYAQRLRQRADNDLNRVPESIGDALSLIGLIRLRQIELSQHEARALSQLQALGFDMPSLDDTHAPN